MPIGQTVSRPIKWPSAEFLAAYDAVCKTLDTNRNSRTVQNAMADIERHGTPEQIHTAREHLDGRARRGPKPQGTPAATVSPAEELKQWAARRDEGLISGEEYETKKAQLLGL